MALTKSQLKEIARSLKVTDHSEHRSYLALVFAEAKTRDPSYSYVKLSKDLGLGSANAHSIISGKRPLTVKAAKGVCDALSIVGVQKRYFLALVERDRAKSTEERDHAFNERLALRQQLLPTELDRRQLAFFEHWYHSAILELMRLADADAEEVWISERLCHKVAKSDIRQSLKLLTELGYLRREPRSGRLRPTDATITTGNEVMGLALASFHRQMLKLALDSIDTVDAEQRDISAITVTASPALLQRFKEDIVELRKRFLQLAAEQEADATDVVQVNIQLFPLTTRKA